MTVALPRMLDRIYAQIPPRVPLPSRARRLSYRLFGSALAPVNWLAAHRYGVPGLGFQARCAGLGLKTTLNRRTPLPARWLLHMLFSPMVLTRYFEFDFAWRHWPVEPVTRYLDVSSPFIFPILALSEGRASHGDLINPDQNDLTLIRQHVDACNLRARCAVHDRLIGDAPFDAGAFDVITSISVVEHIPQNREALQKMWALLKPGGRLVLTAPCAAQSYELWTNLDHYGLLDSDERGFTFLEYVYDEQLLNDNIYRITGSPAACEVYGEVRDGVLREELLQRWSGEYWRFWREPVWMGRNFRRFESIAQLPGEGVIGLVFVKP